MLGGLFSGTGGSTRHRIKERERLAAARKRAQEQAVWQTQEGGGIAEEANISLGYDDTEEEEREEEMNTLGLMI